MSQDKSLHVQGVECKLDGQFLDYVITLYQLVMELP